MKLGENFVRKLSQSLETFIDTDNSTFRNSRFKTGYIYLETFVI